VREPAPARLCVAGRVAASERSGQVLRLDARRRADPARYVVLRAQEPLAVRMCSAVAAATIPGCSRLRPAAHFVAWRTSEELLPGAYLTDGVRLFRVVLQLHRADQRPLAALEDCLTFEVSLDSPDELDEMRLRPVRAGARRALSGSEEVPAASVGSAQSNAGEVSSEQCHLARRDGTSTRPDDRDGSASLPARPAG
jgi:hypothetical protein